MQEITGDIWDYRARAIIAITTNGSVTQEGRAIFGNGVAGQASDRFPWLAARLGELLGTHGNHVYDLGSGIVSFPVEETPWSQPDPRLIARSAGELRMLADLMGWTEVVVPRPGCGGGGLQWREVRPLLTCCFDDRFTVISFPQPHHN